MSKQWEARLSVNGYWFIDYEQGGEGYTLTKLDCDEADSRLIAAAPDMLEALRVAESELRYHAATRNSEALTIARAAIQKAMEG